MKPVTTFAALNSRLALLNRFKTNATRELPVMSMGLLRCLHQAVITTWEVVKGRLSGQVGKLHTISLPD